MNTTRKETKRPLSIWGIRLSIWEVLIVVGCAGIGAALSRTTYGSATTIGAAVGVLLSLGISAYVRRAAGS